MNKMCGNGHIGERYANGQCKICSRERIKIWKKINRDKNKERVITIEGELANLRNEMLEELVNLRNGLVNLRNEMLEERAGPDPKPPKKEIRSEDNPKPPKKENFIRNDETEAVIRDHMKNHPGANENMFRKEIYSIKGKKPTRNKGWKEDARKIPGIL